MPPLLLLATRNRKKRAEIEALLADLPIELATLDGRPELPEVEETGDSFAANARLKAVAIAKAAGAWALGEDSGLVVPAIGGRPGIYSARYAGEPADDAANNAKLLAELAGVPPEKRGAYYVTAAALANPAGEVVAESEGRCGGVILEAPRGDGGFGYDPLFLVPEFHRTFGELSPRVKQALSHRARALGRLRPAVAQIR